MTATADPRERGRSLFGHVLSRTRARLKDDRSGILQTVATGALELAFIEGSALLLGRGAIIGDRSALYAPSFLPDYHGPHFQRALRRLLVPHEGPFVVHFSMTGTCPWTCKYCFASAGGPEAPDVGDELLRVAEALATKRVPIVILGGGEPLGRFERARAVIEILAPASEVRLATSGTGLTPDRARQLAAAGLKVLAISLDSHDREHVDEQRGRGAFDTAIKALRVSADAPFETLVTAVASKRTFAREGSVEGLLELVSKTNPRAVVNFLPEFSTGRSDEGFATPDEYRRYAEALDRTVREGRYRAAVFYNGAIEQLVGCVGAGQRQLVIDTRANLSACVSGASFGNLLEEPFEAVWARMLAAPSRLKRGYFCSHVNQRDEPLPTDEATMLRALRDFHGAYSDAWLQRAIDVLTRATGGSTRPTRTE